MWMHNNMYKPYLQEHSWNIVQRNYISWGRIILTPLDNLWGYFKASPRVLASHGMLLFNKQSVSSFSLYDLMFPNHKRLNMKLLNKIFCQNLTTSCQSQNIDRSFEIWNETYLAPCQRAIIWAKLAWGWLGGVNSTPCKQFESAIFNSWTYLTPLKNPPLSCSFGSFSSSPGMDGTWKKY